MNKSLIRKIDDFTTDIEEKTVKTKRKARKAISSWKFVSMSIIIGAGIALGALFATFMRISAWYDVNKVSFQAPLVIRPAVIVSAREVTVATSSGKTQAKADFEPFLPIINEAYRKIRFMESTAGMNGKDQTATHNYCQSIGQVNEIGYLVDGNRKFCFKDYGEQFLTFRRWFEKRLPTMTIDEALCLWNTGTKQPMCSYSTKYNGI